LFYITAPDNKQIGQKAIGTADFCLFMDNVFDSVNANSVRQSHGKYLRSAVTPNSKHVSFWNKEINVFKSMEFIDNNGKITKPPCVKNWIVTLKGMKYLWQKLSKNNFKFLLTRNINQDPLECLFGQFRQLSGRNINPDCYHFLNSFKTLLLNNYFSITSNQTNCQQHKIDPLINLKSFLTGTVNDEEILIDINFIDINANVYNNKLNNINDMTVSYIAGFIIRKKLVDILKCNICKSELRSENVTNPLIKARQYQTIKYGLCNPTTKLFQFIKDILTISSKCINDIFYKQNVARQLILINEINLKPSFTCPDHDVKNFLIQKTVHMFLFTYFKNINRILRGLYTKQSNIDEIKIMASSYYKTHSKRYKSKIK